MGDEGGRDTELRNNRRKEEPFSELSFPALNLQVSSPRQQKRDRSRVPRAQKGVHCSMGRNTFLAVIESSPLV